MLEAWPPVRRMAASLYSAACFACRLLALVLAMSLVLVLAAATPSSLTLKYFDARGAAETTRVLLAIGGIAYKDHRYAIGPGFEAPEFKADKESGALALNLGRAPLLLTDEGAIGQSKAMERYVASQAGLMCTPILRSLSLSPRLSLYA